MPSAASDQSIQVELKLLIVLLVDNSAHEEACIIGHGAHRLAWPEENQERLQQASSTLGLHKIAATTATADAVLDTSAFLDQLKRDFHELCALCALYAFCSQVLPTFVLWSTVRLSTTIQLPATNLLTAPMQVTYISSLG